MTTELQLWTLALRIANQTELAYQDGAERLYGATVQAQFTAQVEAGVLTEAQYTWLFKTVNKHLDRRQRARA